jgi:hypothetical protein
VPWNALHTEPQDGEVVLYGPSGTPCTMTHWAFGQVSQRAGAPAAYLRSLPVELAANCLNHGLGSLRDGMASLMFHQNGGLVLRAATSDKYTRIWNDEVTAQLLRLVEREPAWTVPPASGLQPSGLYASDRDMFAFMVNDSRRINDGTDEGLARGFFVWNSEVGAASFGMMTFLYRYVCGNHIVWGAENVREVRIRHVGAADLKAFHRVEATLREYADQSVSDDEAIITRAKTLELGGTKEEVLDRLFGMRSLNVTRKALEDAYDTAEQHVDTDGSPRSVWGMVQGLTREAQKVPYADERTAREKAAGKVMKIAF